MRAADLFTSVQSICHIGVMDKKGHTYSGTAFFVTETLLLTAGHLVPDGKRKIIAQKPGSIWCEVLVDSMFKKDPPCQVIPCKFVGSGHSRVDLAVIQVEPPFKATHIMKISQQRVRSGQGIDVIGYVGDYGSHYIRRMHGGDPRRDDFDAVNSLFPKGCLIVSYGAIEATGDELTYAASTVKGMSGGPIVYNGDAIGMSVKNAEFDKGVHMGHCGVPRTTANKAVAFEWDEVWDLLKRFGVVGGNGSQIRN